MIKHHLSLAFLSVFALAGGLRAQTPAQIDFGRDVLPILQQNCVGCHGPAQQMNGLRLDRKSSVFKAGTRRVVPGSLENSFVYYRLIGNEAGRQMPPTGALPSTQIDTIKKWIEQGAEWPDALANENDLPPIDSKAVAAVEALRKGDRSAFMKAVDADPKLLNARALEGSTPFMYAVLYSDASTLEQLLKRGADPNKANDAKATALMWAATDLAKTRVLVSHGAEVNTVSGDFRTALIVAAGHPGGAPVVRFLLDHGANPNASPASSPLIESGIAGDAEIMQLLLAHGAATKNVAGVAMLAAARSSCSRCVELLAAANLEPDAYTQALGIFSYLGDLNLVRLALEHGADVNAFDGRGRTPLMYAAVSDFQPLDVVKLLIERGADTKAKSRYKNSGDAGLTPLDIAKLRGNTPMVDLLVKSGATSTVGSPRPLKPLPTTTIRDSVQRTLPLLQRTDANFTAKSGCVSCHNDSLEALTNGIARRNGFAVDEKIAAQQVKANVSFLEQKRDLIRQGAFIGALQGDPAITAYILIGLDAEHYKADLNTDAVAMFIRSRQQPDGRWAFGTDGRPPLCADGDIETTVLSMRALQLYPPMVDRAAYQNAVERAAAWLANAQPRTYDDRSWRLLGLAWAGKNKTAIQKATRELLDVQRSDGGWSDLPSTESTAYGTGKALVALQTAGLPITDPAYQRGVRFLLSTQMQDGSWYVRTRAAALQPYFDNGFPHGVDQWISAAGTSWATMALALAAQSPAPAN
jgi:N-acyl-D-amino-acid deacylase